MPKEEQLTLINLTSDGSIIAVAWGNFRQRVDEMDRPPAPPPTMRN